MTERIYRAGEEIEASGLYRVSHANGHAAEHIVTALRGIVLPRCPGCGDEVRFRVEHAAHYVLNDACFKPIGPA